MKKILFTIILCLMAVSVMGQSTFKTNLVIQKTTPSLSFKGATGTITFGAVTDMTITHSTGVLTISGGILKIGADTVGTQAYSRAHGSGSGTSMTYPGVGIALSTGAAWGTPITNNSAHWDLAYTDRLKWDGGSTGLVAGTARTSLGATTVGSALLMLTNPSAVTFLRLNADNTVSALSASNFKTALSLSNVTDESKATMFTNPTFTIGITTPAITLGSTAITATGTEINKLAGTPAGLTSTELGYVDGVTSAIQTQLNNTLDGNTVYVMLQPDSVQHAVAYTIQASDIYKDQMCLKTSGSMAITLPANLTSWPVGTWMTFIQEGGAIMVFKKASGVRFVTPKDSVATSNKGDMISIKKIGTSAYMGTGNLTE
jgi:hypothetical protein